MIRAPLADLVWPKPDAAAPAIARRVLLGLAGIGLLAASAKLNLPLPYVPMTLQTLVVLLIGAGYGWQLGTATVLAYLAVGACGVPVFAGPASGLKVMSGATAGFLTGFAVAAGVVGALAERGWDRSMLRLFVAMALGHAIILAMGWGWLAYGMSLGPARAWSVGIAPFLAGALVKNALGAIAIPLAYGALARRGN